MPADRVDALVIFGATGDLAKLETFPALVGLVARGALDVPVVGVAKSGWGLDQFRAYAAHLAAPQRHGPGRPAARKMLALLRYVDGDLDDEDTYTASAEAAWLARAVLPGGAAVAIRPGRRGLALAGRAKGARVMVEKPFGFDLDSARELNDDPPRPHFPEELDLPGGPLARPRIRGQRALRALRQRRSSSRCSTAPSWRASRSPWPRTSASRTAAASTTRPARSAT